MKIAVITMTKDDDIRLEQWASFYHEYKEDVAFHVIVDNASDSAYAEKLKAMFPDSVLLRRTTNGGCTGAYNDGIRYCLEQTDADAIALLANDVRLSPGALSILYKELYEDPQMCLISPVLCEKGTEKIENFGHVLGDGLSMIRTYRGKMLSELENKQEYTELVNGGIYLAKSAFFREVGLQDENLFMYSDEVDTGIRAERAGWKLGVTADAISWHCHIAAAKTAARKPYCAYLQSRNKVYLAKKFFDDKKAGEAYRFFRTIYFKQILVSIVHRDKNGFLDGFYGLRGIKYGRKGDMKPNRYFSPSNM